MKDLVGHYLIVGVLKHEANAPRLLRLGNLVKGIGEKKHLPCLLAVVGKAGLESAQERALAAAGRAAYERDAALGYFEGYIAERRGLLPGIGKAQIADTECRHTYASFRSKRCGAKHSAANAAMPSIETALPPLRMTDG